MMDDDFNANLSSYKIQLRQVEAALSLDPTNEELIQLKTDLDSVISLTIQLLGGIEENDEQSVIGNGASKSSTDISKFANSSTNTNINNAMNQVNSSSSSNKMWKVGEKCLAPLARDGCLREGNIVSIDLRTSKCSVYFESIDHNEIVGLDKIVRPSMSATKSTDGSVKRITKAELNKIKETKRKKLQKKQARLKIQEESQERIKQSWMDFQTKSTGKSRMKGLSKKSIFSTPDSLQGKVGVGTCGIGGKPMTKFENNPFHLQKK